MFRRIGKPIQKLLSQIVRIVPTEEEPEEPAPFWGQATYNVADGTTSSSNGRWGWQFTVGNEAVEINTLRVIVADSSVSVERVLIHANSGGAAIATADIIPSGANVWTSASITPITLQANTAYTISSKTTNLSSRSIRINNTMAVMDGITKGNSVTGTSATNRPTTTSANNIGFVDFGFS